MHIRANAKIFLFEGRPRARTTAAPGGPEGFLEDILEAGKPAPAGPAGAPAPSAAREAFRAKVEAFEIRVGTKAGARAGSCTAAAKTLEARFALGVDLAAIEGLALILIFEEFMRGIELGKARRRLGIVLVGVGMQL